MRTQAIQMSKNNDTAAAPQFQVLDYALKVAALKRRTRQRRRVVMLVHAPEIFSALEPVVQELQRRDDRFELIVVALPRNYSGRVGACHGLSDTYRFLHGKGLSPLAMQGADVRDLAAIVRLAPDFIFRQTPWEHHIPGPFHSQFLGFAQLCYVPYGMGTVDMPQNQHNQPFHNQCDLLFCESPFHLEVCAQHRAMGTIGVHQTGYPRFEAFVRSLETGTGAWPVAVPDDMPRLIWAPHHSVEASWLNYSTFMMYKDAMLAEAQRGRVSIVYRPHPALREKLSVTGLMNDAAYTAYLSAFEAVATSTVDRQPEYVDLFAASDALITDGLGFFSEYLLTGKPMVRTFKEGAQPMNGFGNWCAEAARVVHDGAALRTVLDEIAEHAYVDELAPLRLERQVTLQSLCEGASQRIVDLLEVA